MMEERLNRTPEEEAEEAQEEAQRQLEQETAEEEKLGEAQQPEEAQVETEEEREERERLMEVAELAARLTLMHRQAWEEEAGEDLILARELRRLHEGESVQEILAQLNEARDRQAAERLNMNPEELMALRSFMFERVYARDWAANESQKAAHIVSELVRYYMEHPTLMPNEYLEIAYREGTQRGVCDYVACMTDAYAVKTYQKLFIPPFFDGIG